MWFEEGPIGAGMSAFDDGDWRRRRELTKLSSGIGICWEVGVDSNCERRVDGLILLKRRSTDIRFVILESG